MGPRPSLPPGSPRAGRPLRRRRTRSIRRHNRARRRWHHDTSVPPRRRRRRNHHRRRHQPCGPADRAGRSGRITAAEARRGIAAAAGQPLRAAGPPQQQTTRRVAGARVILTRTRKGKARAAGRPRDPADPRSVRVRRLGRCRRSGRLEACLAARHMDIPVFHAPDTQGVSHWTLIRNFTGMSYRDTELHWNGTGHSGECHTAPVSPGAALVAR